MNDVYHQEVERWARQQREHFHDRVDDRNHPMARIIHQNIQKIEDAAQAGHNIRSLHDQIRVVERQMEQAKHTPSGFMTVDHAESMYHNFRGMAESLRRHPHF
jgi:hypothetical protein